MGDVKKKLEYLKSLDWKMDLGTTNCDLELLMNHTLDINFFSESCDSSNLGFILRSSHIQGEKNKRDLTLIVNDKILNKKIGIKDEPEVLMELYNYLWKKEEDKRKKIINKIGKS